MRQLKDIFFLRKLLSIKFTFKPSLKIPEIESEIKVTYESQNEWTQNLTELVNMIAEINEVQYERVGFGGVKGENYENFEKLKKIAKTEDLLQMTNHINATVACYASWALADKSYSDLKTIFENFVLHDRKVKTFSGCIKSFSYISLELYDRYYNNVAPANKATDEILVELDKYKSNYFLFKNRFIINK